MKQVILIITLFLLVSCGQGNDKGTANTSTDSGKESKTVTDTSEDKMPIEVALSFINSYIEDCNKTNKSLGYLKFVNSNSLTTNNFKTELKKVVDEANKADPEMGLDFDPLIDAQDFPDKGFELETFDRQTNFIVVKGKNWADFKVTIKVVLENNNWLVDGCGIINIPREKQSKR